MERERRLKKAALEGNTQELREICSGESGDSEILGRVRTSLGETLLHVAAFRGHTEFAELLLSLKPCLAKYLDSTDSLALHLASAKGYVPIVKALLLANPHLTYGDRDNIFLPQDMCLAQDRDGFFPLHLAAKKGMVEVLMLLVDIFPLAAKFKLPQGGRTVLHLCVKHFQIESLKLLMKAVNDTDFINDRDDDGNTILHLAVYYKQTETVKYLLTSDRIDVNATNRRLNTALDVLDQSQREVRDGDIRNALQEAGALKYFPLSAEVEALFVEDPHMWPDKCLARDRYGFTPIHLAAKNGMLEILKFLVRYFRYAAKVKLCQGGTVLHLCVKHFQIESLKLLMEAVNDTDFINDRDDDGNTILHLAVFYEQTEIVKYLLTYDRIDVNATNNCHHTALDLSRREARDGDIQKALQERVFQIHVHART